MAMAEDYTKLMFRRVQLLQERNGFVRKLFYLLRPKLKRKVQRLDKQIDNLDRRIANLRRLVVGRKVVRSSNLALRFYKRDGWLKETLETYLSQGSLIDSELRFGDAHDEAYFVFEPGAKVDVKSLYFGEVAEVDRQFDDRPEETDLEFLERMATLC
jgi:hypothetical protein